VICDIQRFSHPDLDIGRQLCEFRGSFFGVWLKNSGATPGNALILAVTCPFRALMPIRVEGGYGDNRHHTSFPEFSATSGVRQERDIRILSGRVHSILKPPLLVIKFADD
jgi:hypothetical protein